MVSQFRRNKFMRVFNIFLDTDKSGYIEQKDFDLIIANITKLRGYKEGDVIHSLIKELLTEVWNGLKNEADKDGDGKLSVEEWVQIWDKYSKNPDSGADWQKVYCRCIFQLEDAGNDGEIDGEEFSTVYASFGLPKQEGLEAFKKLSRGKEKINWDEFQVLWNEYYVSEDASEAGNYIFGSLG